MGSDRWRPFSQLLSFLLVILSAPAAFAQATAQQYLNAGNQLYGAKDYTRAVQYYRAAIQMDPNNAAAYQGLGSGQYALGQKREALASFERSLQLNPNNPALAGFTQRLRTEVGSAAPGLPSLPSGNQPGALSFSGSSDYPLLQPLPGTGTGVAAQPLSIPSAKTSSGNKGSGDNDRGYSRNLWDISIGPAFGDGGAGFGLGSTYYFPINRSFSVGIASNLYIFTRSQSTPYTDLDFMSYFVEGVLQVKYSFPGKTIWPFLLAGGGLASSINTVSYSDFYGSNSDMTVGFGPMLTAGGGVEFPLGGYVTFFAKARISLILGGTTIAYNPLGYLEEVDSGSSSYFPIEAGFTFPL